LYSQEGPYIFLVIGDGMDDSQIAIAEHYYEELGGLESFVRMHDRSSAMIEGYDLGDGLSSYCKKPSTRYRNYYDLEPYRCHASCILRPCLSSRL
jgi:hypothetical protein